MSQFFSPTPEKFTPTTGGGAKLSQKGAKNLRNVTNGGKNPDSLHPNAPVPFSTKPIVRSFLMRVEKFLYNHGKWRYAMVQTKCEHEIILHNF